MGEKRAHLKMGFDINVILKLWKKIVDNIKYLKRWKSVTGSDRLCNNSIFFSNISVLRLSTDVARYNNEYHKYSTHTCTHGTTLKIWWKGFSPTSVNYLNSTSTLQYLRPAISCIIYNRMYIQLQRDKSKNCRIFSQWYWQLYFPLTIYIL